MIRHLLKNPCTIWLNWLFFLIRAQWNNRGRNVRIGYMAYAKRSALGRHSALHDGAVLVDGALGDFSYLAAGAQLGNTRVGKFCSIGPGVKSGLGRHPTRDFVSTHPAFYSVGGRQANATLASQQLFNEHLPIEIGNDVWIGAHAVLVDGVKIGDGAIVAAGSVVVSDVEPYSIVGGVPAGEIRKRFATEQVATLRALAWWDWSEEKLRKHQPQFSELASFLAAVKPSK